MKKMEFEIVLKLSEEYSVKSLIEVMNVSRSGYYKWLKTKDELNRYEQARLDLEELIKDIHQRKPSYGYHRINTLIYAETGWCISSNLVHKVCKLLGIKSKARKYRTAKKSGEESTIYPNLIYNDWNVDKPFEVIVTDTTMIKFDGIRYDWTYYLDVFNNEIVGSDIEKFHYGMCMNNHKKALREMIYSKQKRGYKNQETIMHSDQGSIYTSNAFNNAHKDYNILRSMSRAGTPTDNPIIESINGWIKNEIQIDFNQSDYKNVNEYIAAIIYDFNYKRPSYKLKYKTPIQYRTELGF